MAFARAFVLLLLVTPAVAKPLGGRVGVGFENSFSSLSSLSIKWCLPVRDRNLNLQLQAVGGFSLLEGIQDTYFAGGRLLYGFLAEDNMNLYAAAGVGYGRFSGGQEAVRLSPTMAAEFFLFGLDSLGLTIEWGIHADVGTATEITSVGSSFASLGAHYYF